MKTWVLMIESNPQEIINKLGMELTSDTGFAFNVINNKSDNISFNLRKRLLFSSRIYNGNKIVLNGKILKANSDTMTNIEISFTQNFLLILITSIYFILGLYSLNIGLTDRSFTYTMGGVLLLAYGFIYYRDSKKKFLKDIVSYKTLISDILEIKDITFRKSK